MALFLLSSDNFVSLDGIPTKQVTRVQTLCEVFNQQRSLKTFLTEVHKLLKLYLTIPVTTSSSERNFSALKRIKTYLRNSVTQQRLNHCMVLYIHQERTNALELNSIAEEFAQANERLIAFSDIFNQKILDRIKFYLHAL